MGVKVKGYFPLLKDIHYFVGTVGPFDTYYKTDRRAGGWFKPYLKNRDFIVSMTFSSERTEVTRLVSSDYSKK